MSNSDYVAYQRAVGVSIFGLVVQLMLGGGLLVYSAITNDWAVRPVAYPILLGALVWLSLALVFHQHKLERLEALEAEAFQDSDASAASVFEGVAADQQVQQNRLRWMHKWLLPAVSVVLALSFVLTGVAVGGGETPEITSVSTSIDSSEDTGLPGQTGFAMALGAVMAVVGFIFARFVAGMAKQPIWMLLNGGAAASVGASLFGLLIALAHFMPASLQTAWLLENMPTIVSIALYVLGAEVALNFLANLYRPRQTGQYLRPAFDSRVLAYVAAPDRLAESISGAINYQFGFNVSSTWFYKLLSRWLAALTVVAAGLVWAMTGIAVVEPDERGLLLRGGTLASEEPLQPGVTLKRPWPFDRVVRFPATAINTITVGSVKEIDTNTPLLWTDPDDPAERFYIVQPSSSAEREDETDSGPRDLSLVTFEVNVQYLVRDLVSYYQLAQDGDEDAREANRQRLLRAVAEGAVTSFVSQYSVDEVLAGSSGGVGEELQRTLQTRFDTIDAGVDVVFAGLIGAHPAGIVSEEFEKLVSADPVREALIAIARAEATETMSAAVGRVDLARQIIAALHEIDDLREGGADASEIRSQELAVEALVLQAGGAAAEQIEEARAERWKTVMDERGRASRILGQRAAFNSAPRVYLSTLFLQSLRGASAGGRVMVVPPELDLVLDKIETAQDFDFGAAPTEEQ